MDKRQNCLYRHANGNCLFNGGFCLANNEEHCVRINEIKSYNQALEDFIKAYKEKSSMENKLVDDIAEQLKR